MMHCILELLILVPEAKPPALPCKITNPLHFLGSEECHLSSMSSISHIQALAKRFDGIIFQIYSFLLYLFHKSSAL